MVSLSDEQRRVVEFSPEGGHLLVRAAPGSGKTETITRRIGHLIDHHAVDPDAILALTFTRRAAEDLAHRIRPAAVWSGTFHAIGADILERWGAVIGVEPPLLIYAEARQHDLLLRALAAAGVTTCDDERDQRRFGRELKDRISRRKRRGLEMDRREGDEQIPDDLMALVHETYCRLLSDEGALDYDDLITRAITVLRTEDDAAAHYRARLRLVFIDEFHDISPEQFALVRLLAPPRGTPVQLTAIVDPDQAIYDWRGADVAAMLGALRREYRPRELHLTRNFRSTKQIIDAANAVIGDERQTRQAMTAKELDAAPELAVYAVRSRDETAETARLVDYIERAVASGRYTYGDIAVLYRTHRRSRLAAEVLPHQGIPIWRVEPERFMSQPEVQDALRYLELLVALRDDHFVPALNWPRVLVDEVTMVHLRRLAAREAVTLCDLARRIDQYREQVSPLTRAAIRDFFATVAEPLGELVEGPVQDLVEPFLDALRRRRSPLPRADRPALRDTLDLLGRHLRLAEAVLATAIAAGRPIVVRAGPDGDSVAASVIIEHTLCRYLDRDVVTAGMDATVAADAFVIDLGRTQPASDTGFGLTVWATPHVSFSLGTQAWRLGQMLLMRYEQVPALPLVLFDLETGDRHPSTAEVVDIGALWIGDEDQEPRAFARLVRPSGPHAITKRAGEIHGLTWSRLGGEPAVAEVLPELMSFLEGAVLVGHNVEDFDYPILVRLAREQGAPEPRHHLIDTMKMARRLLPDQRSYRLEDLARHFDPAAKQDHRALHDVKLNGRLLSYLRQVQRDQQELETLSEALPLVALSIAAAGLTVRYDNELLVRAGARAASFGQGAALRSAWQRRVDAASAPSSGWLDQQETRVPADDTAWQVMEENWRTATAVFAGDGADNSLRAFLRYAAMAEPIDVVPLAEGPGPAAGDLRRLGKSERVAMMTVHSAKGLEWPLVFLLGVEEDQFPNYRASTSEQVAEERRLLYVGMTRAQRRLCLLWSGQVAGRRKQRSPFLDGMARNVINHHRPG
jgi:superfamily I DNA/RNA helicase